MAVAGLNLSCATAGVPAWNGRLFFGDSAKEGLSRNSSADPDFISVHNKQRFEQMVCVSKPDFKSLIDTYIGGCAKWKTRPGSILVSPELLVKLVQGERTVQSLRPDEYTINAPEAEEAPSAPALTP